MPLLSPLYKLLAMGEVAPLPFGTHDDARQPGRPPVGSRVVPFLSSTVGYNGQLSESNFDCTRDACARPAPGQIINPNPYPFLVPH